MSIKKLILSLLASLVYTGLGAVALQKGPRAPVNREYELRMFDYYGRPTYWQAPVSVDGPGGSLPPVL